MRLTALIEYPPDMSRERLAAHLSKLGLRIIKVQFHTLGKPVEDPSLKPRAIALAATGLGSAAIGRELGISQQRAHSYIRKGKG